MTVVCSPCQGEYSTPAGSRGGAGGYKRWRPGDREEVPGPGKADSGQKGGPVAPGPTRRGEAARSEVWEGTLSQSQARQGKGVRTYTPIITHTHTHSPGPADRRRHTHV